MAEVNDVVVELQEEAMRLSRRSIDRGCVDSWIASNLAGRAADLLAHQAARLEEVTRERDGWKANCQVQLEETHRNMARRSAAEAALTAAEAEKERYREALGRISLHAHLMLPASGDVLGQIALDALSPKKEQTDGR